MKKFLWSIFLLLVFSSPSWSATDYYVRTGGNDNCNGTTDANGSSGSCAFRTIQKGLDTATTAGDTVTVHTGDYTSEGYLTHQAPGSSGNYITLQGATGETVTVSRVGTDYNYSRYINLTITGSSDYGNAGAILSGSYGYMTGCTFVGVNTSDDVYAMQIDGGTYNTIISNTFYGHFWIVFWVHTANNTFENNTIRDIPDCERVWSTGVSSASNSNDTIVRGNTVSNLTKPELYGAPHVDIFQGFSFSGTNTSHRWIIENNYFHDIDGQIGIIENAADSTAWVFRNNVFANITESMMLATPNTVYYNNTFFQTTSNTADTWDFGESGLLIKNNIMIGRQAGATTGLCYTHDDGTSAVIQNNFFAMPKDSSYGARDSTRFTNDCGGTAAGNINGGDPKFIAAYNDCVANTCNFNLQASSPLIGNGATLTGFTTDKAGTTRSVPWDIGAYEYTSGVFPATATGLTITGGTIR